MWFQLVGDFFIGHMPPVLPTALVGFIIFLGVVGFYIAWAFR